MPKKKQKKKYISYIVRVLVAGIALYLAFKGEDFSKVLKLLLSLHIWTWAAVWGLWFISQLVFVARWTFLQSVLDIRIGFWTALRLHFMGIFYNNCLPTAVGGDLLRAWYVTNHTEKKLEAALTVAVDRAVGLTGMVILAFCSYLFIPAQKKNALGLQFSLPNIGEYKAVFLAVIACVTFILVLLIKTEKGRLLLKKILEHLKIDTAQIYGKVKNAVAVYYNKKWALLCALLLTFACQAVFIAGLWVAGKSIGIDAHIKYYFIFFPLAWVSGALPISVGGLGIWEGVIKITFALVSTVPSEHLAALALAHRVIWLFGSLPGALIHLVGAHLPKHFSVD